MHNKKKRKKSGTYNKMLIMRSSSQVANMPSQELFKPKSLFKVEDDCKLLSRVIKHQDVYLGQMKLGNY